MFMKKTTLIKHQTGIKLSLLHTSKTKQNLPEQAIPQSTQLRNPCAVTAFLMKNQEKALYNGNAFLQRLIRKSAIADKHPPQDLNMISILN